VELIGSSLDLVGTVMITYTILSVHYRVRKEHKIDDIVFKQMRREQAAGIIGITLIVIGYFLQLPSRLQL